MLKKFVSVIFLLFSISFTQDRFDSTKIYLTHIYGIELERTNISDLENIFGKTNVHTSGEAGGYSQRYNYFFADDNSYVTFDVTEMGGGNTILLFKLNADRPNESFKKVNNRKLNELDIGGIRLGDSFKKVKSYFGNKAKVDKNKISASYWFKRPISSYVFRGKTRFELPKNITECDLTISFQATFKNNKLISLEVYRITTF